ncbi:hypothetical protein J4446_00490 [Candidatus Woesearchaeota archaeon]|nr:hypothetical protein [Candidatus Woesearchaeota archaeon]
MKEQVMKAINEFNRHKSKEVNASLVNIKSNIIKIKFSGELLCRSYCLNDYFEDLMHDFNDKGVKSEINLINTDETCENYLVEYEIL